MKLKSLLFGSAAAMVAVTGAQAADLPIAEPVEYVRICDAFGTGFYYIPGTDTCLRVGGRVRVEMHWVDADPPRGTSIANTDRNFNNYTSRARGYVRLDARNQTDFGMLRANLGIYQTIGPSNFGDSYAEGTTLETAFIQISNDMGTFTFGHASSFFDYWATYAYNTRIGTDDPTGEQTLMAYTFNVGNGVSASLSLEDSKSGHGRSAGAGLHGGNRYPDLVANIRVDQGWGSAQIMGALHEVRGAGPGVGDTDLGWAIGAGAEVAVPGTAFSIGGQAGYSEGAAGYIMSGSAGYGGIVAGTLTDGGYTAAGGVSLTSAWTVRGGISADFATNWTASISASYGDVDSAASSGIVDFDLWGVAANVAWTPVSGFLLGVEAAYSSIDFAPGTASADADAWGLMVRGQRTF